MGKLDEFEKSLRKKSKGQFARWRRIDLHNHSPVSFDYDGNKATAVADSAARLREARINIVMFTDHEELPTAEFVDEVAKSSGALVLRGIELNVFVDAWQKPRGKVSKNLFFHLLVGFDPDGEQPPEYWLNHIQRSCAYETRDSGGRGIPGVTDLQKLCEILQQAGAIVVPAHMHSTSDAFKSRSVDDIYDDLEFLKFARDHCTALEMRNDDTAAFFDGAHKETGLLEMSCLKSSDSHEAATLGSNFSWAQMENISFAELKAALEMPFRFSRFAPTTPESYVVGLNVQGAYFSDLWIAFSPHCNALIGVKGSGKTAILECLRYVLGTDVPEARLEGVREHLGFILGAGGVVRALVRRSDGTKILIERRLSSPEYTVHFPDDRSESFENSEAFDFPTHVLGWHEIEQAAEDPDIRRIYMDTIAGPHQIKSFERDAIVLADRIKENHTIAASKYYSFKEINDQVSHLEERRRGLQELDDDELLALHKEYEVAVQNVESFRALPSLLVGVSDSWENNWERLWSTVQREPFDNQGELEAILKRATGEIIALFQLADDSSQQLQSKIQSSRSAIEADLPALENGLHDFLARYESAISELTPEQKRLLESHRSVAEETATLPSIRAQRDQLREELRELLIGLENLCGQIVDKLNARSDTRKQAINEFGNSLSEAGVYVDVETNVKGKLLGELRSKYHSGAEIFDQLGAGEDSAEPRHHSRLRARYRALRKDLEKGSSLFFGNPEFEYFLRYFEDDDLKIEFQVGENVRKPIDQLSAGQRCTAIFPLILKLQSLPLVVDQPEDNLDNRYIASNIARGQKGSSNNFHVTQREFGCTQRCRIYRDV